MARTLWHIYATHTHVLYMHTLFVLTLKRSSTFLMKGYSKARATANAIETQDVMLVCFGITSLCRREASAERDTTWRGVT